VPQTLHTHVHTHAVAHTLWHTRCHTHTHTHVDKQTHTHTRDSALAQCSHNQTTKSYKTIRTHPIPSSHPMPDLSVSPLVYSHTATKQSSQTVCLKKKHVTHCTSCLLISQSGTYPPIPQVPRARGLIAACHQSTSPVSPISCCNAPSALAYLAAAP